MSESEVEQSLHESYMGFRRLEEDARKKLGLGPRAGYCAGAWQKGPLIIGGMSDSGSRGATKIFQDYFGITMSPKTTDAGHDSARINNAVAVWWHSLLAQAKGRLTTLDFSRALFWTKARDALCAAVQAEYEDAGSPDGHWGFASPRSIVMVPVWEDLFGDDWKFVHTMRDPRASCRFYNNKVQYVEVCPWLMNPPFLCEYMSGCFRYWADLNFQIMEFFYLSDKMDKYIPFPMERVAVAEGAGSALQHEFLKHEIAKIFPGVTDKKITEVQTLMLPYVSHYNGGEIPVPEMNILSANFVNLTTSEVLVGNATTLLGYDKTAYGPTGSWELEFK